MYKQLVLFTLITSLLIFLSSCGQRSDTFEVKQKLDIVVEKEAKQKTVTQSAMDKVSPEVLATLDLDLTSKYNVGDGGPREWDEKTWEWKILLNWHQHCNFSPSINEYKLSSSTYSFVAIDCGGGLSANTIYHVFLFDPNTKKSIRLELFEQDDPNRDDDIPEEVWGYMEIDTETNILSLVNRSGAGTCGTYRVYEFIEGESLQASKFKRTTFRARGCNINPALDNSPFESFDYENWPVIEDLSTLET